MEVEYKEGEGAKWIILKRYGDFVDLHDSLSEFFQRRKEANKMVQAPTLPPQIQKQNDAALDFRKTQLENYIKSVMQIGDYPPVLLQFLEFAEHFEFNGRNTILENLSLADYAEKKIRIIQNKVRIDNHKAKTFYILEVLLSQKP